LAALESALKVTPALAVGSGNPPIARPWTSPCTAHAVNNQCEEHIVAKSPQPNSRHVVSNPNGGWDVKKPGANRSSAHTDTQREATERAAEIVRNSGGGEVRIHGRNGQIRDSNTVAPGHDPYPPKG